MTADCSLSLTRSSELYGSAPHLTRTGCGARQLRGQLSDAYATKSAHASGARTRRGLASRCLESRTWMVPGVVATSTQESPSGPLL